MASLGVLWSQYGPYHFARISALKVQASSQSIHALEIASRTHDYQWSRSGATVNLITLFPGDVAEQLSFWRVFFRTRKSFAQLRLDVCFIPSYSPKQPLAALLAAKSLGVRTVLMIDSHKGTMRTRMLGTWLKRRLVRLFDAALVGGKPQMAYVESLGMDREKIFVGYDTVDNEYFARRAADARSRAAELRDRYDLPNRYFLSLGRFMRKKNLGTLIRAYRRFLDSTAGTRTHLVMVGSGEEETNLRMLCDELRLPVYNKMAPVIDLRESSTADCRPGVHFYGFRQIEENPTFYALSDAFILPSTVEEWGLVINEALSCSLPVVVSETVGSAEDLLRPGTPPGSERSMAWKPQLGKSIRQNGFVFDPKSVASLTDALLTLDADPVLRQTMGEAGRLIVEDFSCEKFARNALLAASKALKCASPATPDVPVPVSSDDSPKSRSAPTARRGQSG
ncbi:MAG TPA: glycosyltransferase family 4 protein [Steroidobacteraceae bacterium]|jgi:glycosyltransferase involved in cell wall biosynthesis|nr:glycosyltransferase family 4 protein [Steroidobacteraceae bacterium]